jgi:hypothetical protein
MPSIPEFIVDIMRSVSSAQSEKVKSMQAADSISGIIPIFWDSATRDDSRTPGPTRASFLAGSILKEHIRDRSIRAAEFTLRQSFDISISDAIVTTG